MDAVVVGGGVIGLAAAWRAAGRGLRVAVADPAPGRGASYAAAGMLAPVTELWYGEEDLLSAGLDSAGRYPSFVAELEEATGQRVGYSVCGTLAVALDADDRAALRRLADLTGSLGLTAEWLTSREARRAEPLLDPRVAGGLLVPDDHQVDPRALTRALRVAAERAGVSVHESRAEILLDGDRVTGVRLVDGTEIHADAVVLAAGCWSGQVPGLPEAAAPPVRPVKGQILRLRVPPERAPFLSRTVRGTARGGRVYLVPRSDGEVVVGATSEEMGFDTTVTAGGVYELLRDAHALVPGITEIAFEQAWAGPRPGSPDNAPLIGPGAVDGLIVATGHYRGGVLLAPLTAEAVADLLVGKSPPAAVTPFGPGRFGRGRVSLSAVDSLSMSETVYVSPHSWG